MHCASSWLIPEIKTFYVFWAVSVSEHANMQILLSWYLWLKCISFHDVTKFTQIFYDTFVPHNVIYISAQIKRVWKRT